MQEFWGILTFPCAGTGFLLFSRPTSLEVSMKLSTDTMDMLAPLASHPQGSRVHLPAKYQQLVETLVEDAGSPGTPTSALATVAAAVASPAVTGKKAKPKPRMQPVLKSEATSGNHCALMNTPEGHRGDEGVAEDTKEV
jgi:hypothetical protein